MKKKNKTYCCVKCGDEYPIPADYDGTPTICYSCAMVELEPQSDDDGEHWDMDRAQEEADNLDAESHLLSVDEPSF